MHFGREIKSGRHDDGVVFGHAYNLAQARLSRSFQPRNPAGVDPSSSRLQVKAARCVRMSSAEARTEFTGFASADAQFSTWADRSSLEWAPSHHQRNSSRCRFDTPRRSSRRKLSTGLHRMVSGRGTRGRLTANRVKLRHKWRQASSQLMSGFVANGVGLQ
jgi:hypothetical protein